MHRGDGDGNDGGMFVNGDPGAGIAATEVRAEWLTAIQEELVGVILAAGITLDKGDNTQLLAALNNRYGRLGSANTWTAGQTMNSTLSVGSNATVGGTLGVTGNTSLGGSLAVTATTTLTGLLTLNGGATLPSGKTLTLNGTVTVTNGLTATNSTTGAPGLEGTGGSSFSVGVKGNGGPSDGWGIHGVGGGTNGIGVWGDGKGTGAAGYFKAGSGASSTVARTAVVCEGGHLVFNSTPTLNSNVAVTNTLAPANIPKAMAKLVTDAAGNVAVSGAFNITSASIVSSVIRVTFASAFASSDYEPLLTQMSSTNNLFSATPISATQIEISARTPAGASTSLATTAVTLSLVCFGIQ
jgi:hypothetical protein